MMKSSQNIDEQGQCISCSAHGVLGQACASQTCEGLHHIDLDRAAKHVPSHKSLVGQMIDDYLIVEPLGQGGFGTVYLGLKRPNFHTKGAIKIFDPSVNDDEVMQILLRYFVREIRTLSSLNEPNIVQLMDEGEYKGSPYFVMRYVDSGVLLRDRMLPGRCAQPAFIENVVTQIVRALKAAHHAGIVHRDLKPENIMLQGEADHVYVLDFGLAKGAEDQTQTQASFGTPYYMAPEQLFPSRDELFTPYWPLASEPRTIGPACDLYALGVIVTELMTGHPVFASDSTAELCVEKDRLRADPLEIIPSHYCTPEVSAFLRKALHYLPEQRFTDAQSFLDALLQILPAYEEHVTGHPGLEVGFASTPSKIDSADAFQSTAIVEDSESNVLAMADTQLASGPLSQRALVSQEITSEGDLHALDSPDASRRGDTEPLEDDREGEHSEEDVDDNEPIYQYRSNQLVYGLAALVLFLCVLVAVMFAQTKQPSASKLPKVVQSQYDQELEQVRAMAAGVPTMLENGEYAQIVALAEELDKKEAKLTPEEYKRVRAIVDIAQDERLSNERLIEAERHVNASKFEDALPLLKVIPKDAHVRSLKRFAEVEEDALRGLLQRAYAQVVQDQADDTTKQAVRAVLSYAPTDADAMTLAKTLNIDVSDLNPSP